MDFIGKRWIGFVLSSVLFVVCLSTLAYKGITGTINLGIDFAGGTEMQVKFAEKIEPKSLRNVLSSAGYGNAELQSFKQGDEFIIRVKGTKGANALAADMLALRKKNGRINNLSDILSLPSFARFTIDDLNALFITEDVKSDTESDEYSATKFKDNVNSITEEQAKIVLQRVLDRVIVDRIMSAISSKIYSDSDMAGFQGKKDLNSVSSPEAFTEIVTDKTIAEKIISYKDSKVGGLIISFDELKDFISADLIAKAKEKFYLGKMALVRTELVGPRIGKELQVGALKAIGLSMLVILLYVTFRFEFQFALGGVLALVHDVIIVAGIMTLIGREITIPLIAALLTLAGYSINDTIVVFDRIRENIKLNRKDSDFNLINNSINQTISRTINTSLTTLLTSMALWIFGGEVVRDFSFSFSIGVVIGTYSSIFIASTLVFEWNRFFKVDFKKYGLSKRS